VGVRIVIAAVLAIAFAAGTALKGDPQRGEEIYARCGACHAIENDRTGPRHCGLFGRRAGSVPGFAYSPAMKRSGIVWDARTLDRFLTNPLRAVPGTTMGYAGIDDAQERADLIEYLRAATSTARCTR
jgi:cytochrome c